MKRKQDTGFTLLEVMVVVVILGILATLIIPNIFDRLTDAKVQTTRQNLKTIESELEMFRMDNNRYPTTDEGLRALVNDPGTVRKYPREGYLREIPEDSWGNRLVYMTPGRDGRFDLYSHGADGQPGGEGADADITTRRE